MYVRPRPRFRPRNAGSGNTPSLALEFNQLSALPSYVTFSRGTQAMQYGSDGTLQYAPNNLLTYSNQADNAAWTKSNSFVQTNLLTYSEQFDNVIWTVPAGSIGPIGVNSTIAPDGTLTADTISATSANTIFWQTYSPSAAGIPYTGSIWLKRKTGSGNVQISSYDSSTFANVDLSSGGWVRATQTNTSTIGTKAVGIRIVTSGDEVYVWGAQLVQGSVPGDYRATTSAALPVLYADYNGALRARKLSESSSTSRHECTPALPITAIAGAVYNFSIEAKAGERTAFVVFFSTGETVGDGYAIFNLAAGTVNFSSGATASITAANNGYYRCSLVVTTVGATLTPFVGLLNALSVSRLNSYAGDGSSGIYIADAQLTPGYLPLAVTETTSAAVYGPRFDYDPVTKVARGLLIEEQRTNLFTFSNDFTNVIWSNANVTVTPASTTSPEGVVNMSKLAATAGAATSLYQSAIVAATSASGSIYVKQGTGATTANAFVLRNVTTALDLVGGTLNYSTGVWTYSTGSTGVVVRNIGNGIWRVEMSASAGITAGDTIRLYTGFAGGAATAGDFLYAYGAQLEAGAFATSYIPTVASTATRNADSASITTLTPWFNAAAGTLYSAFAIRGFNSGVSNAAVSLSDGTASNFIVNRINTTPQGNFTVRAATVDQATISDGTASLNTTMKIAGVYATNDFAASVNGAAAITDLSGTVPTVNQLVLGATGVVGTNPLNGWISSIRYYPTRLPNASLQSITV